MTASSPGLRLPVYPMYRGIVQAHRSVWRHAWIWCVLSWVQVFDWNVNIQLSSTNTQWRKFALVDVSDGAFLSPSFFHAIIFFLLPQALPYFFRSSFRFLFSVPLSRCSGFSVPLIQVDCRGVTGIMNGVSLVQAPLLFEPSISHFVKLLPLRNVSEQPVRK